MSNTVPEGWREGAIGDVVSSMEGGVSVNSENRPPNLNEYGILKTSSVVDGYFRPSECKAILPAEIGRAKVNPKQGAILFSRMNTPALVGQSGYVDKDFLRTFLPDRLWQITIRREFNSRWFSYLLRCDSTVRHIADAATGTSGSMKNISKPSLLGIPVCIPPLPEQQKIAAILSSVDDVIEKTRAQIDKLKDLKTGVMQELLTKGIGPDGAPHTAFKDSPVGRIPEEWAVCMASEVAEEVMVGVVIKPTQYYVDSGIPALRSANVRENGLTMENLKYFSIESNEKLKKSKLRKGDLLTVRTGYPGTTAVVTDGFEGCNCIDVVITRPSERMNSNFFSMWVNSDGGKGQVLKAQGGLAQQHFNVGDMKNLLIVVPPLEEQKSIFGVVDSVAKKISTAEARLDQVGKVKKALMQDLLTGKVRVNVS